MNPVVTFLWVRSARRALERADRATTIAALQQRLALQNQQEAEQKRLLEESIQEIVRIHTRAAQGDLSARVSLLRNNVLWEVAGMLNNLLSRMQRMQQAEIENQRTRQAAAYLVQQLQSSPDTLIQWPAHTGTALDSIVTQYNTNLRMRTRQW